MPGKWVFNPFTGKLDWTETGGSGGGSVPIFVADGETFSVAENTQVLYAMPLDNEGTLEILGYFVEVA